MGPQEIRNLQEAYMKVVENQQLDELSVGKMLDYAKKGEKNRADLNKKWDQGKASYREKMRVLGREEGEARASDKVEKKTGKRPYQMNALDKARYAVTKEEVELDEAAVNWNTGKTKSGLSPEEKTTLKFVQHGLSNKPQNQKRAEQQALVHQNMTDAIKKTGKRKVDKVGPIASKRFKNAAIRKRGGKQPSVPIKTVSGLKDANKESQSKLNKEQTDLYDIILSHLLDEGFASTEQSADKIILNMSESWFEEILNERTRFAKETGKNVRTGRPSVEGGDPKVAERNKLPGYSYGGSKQEPKERGKKPPSPSEEAKKKGVLSPLEHKVALRRNARQRASDFRMDTRGT
jgi:hypothetical protein